MTKGEIYLYDYDDTLLYERVYGYIGERKLIIETWKMLMGEKFERMYFQIHPRTRPDLVAVDGTNRKMPFEKKTSLLIKKPMERFPAIYDNTNRSLYK